MKYFVLAIIWVLLMALTGAPSHVIGFGVLLMLMGLNLVGRSDAQERVSVTVYMD